MNMTSNNNQRETTQETRKRYATIVAAVLLVTLAAFDIFSTNNYFSQPNNFLLFAMLLSYIATASTIVNTWLIRNGRVNTGTWGMILTNLIALFLSPFLGKGLGFIYGITAIVITLAISRGLDPKQVRLANLVGIGFGIATIVLDILLPSTTTANPNNGFTYIILFSLILALLIIVSREFAGYNLRNKLLVSFSAVAFLAIIVGVIANLGLRNVQTEYQHALEDGGELRAISLTISNDLLTARRHEKDFLLRWQDQGFDTAYANYAVPNQEAVDAMLGHIDNMEQFGAAVGETFSETYSQAQYQIDLLVLKEATELYDLEFQKTVQLIQERGFQDTGLEGEFRTAVQAIETRILNREGLDPLAITMLQIRRREKDYLLRGDQQYIDNVHQLINDLKSQVSASEILNSAEKAQILLLADQYVIAFDSLVEKDIQIAAAIEAFRDAAHTVEPIVEKLQNTGAEMSQFDTATAQTNASQTLLFLYIALTVALLVAGFLSVFLSGQITRPVTQLTKTAQTIAGGNFDVQAEVISADEIGTLASTFNTMTRRLSEAFEDVRRRAAELSTVAEVSTATSTILDSKQLLQNVVDLTKERFNLYHSHIYLLDEKGENLVLTAGAGEPGRVMVAEGRSIPLNREQSLVARAARERQGVTVNDVTQATDHLPNPLLPDTRSELAVPMVVGGNVIGVFDIQSEQVGRFTETDVNIQTTLASQLATSIQNVRSFERSRKEAELQSLVNVIGSRIQRTTSIEETLQTAIRELGTAIGASSVKAKIQPATKAVSTEPTSAD